MPQTNVFDPIILLVEGPTLLQQTLLHRKENAQFAAIAFY
jgi:hypothetical protein